MVGPVAGVATVAWDVAAWATVLQEATVRGVDPTVALVIWVLVAALGLFVGHQLGTWYATRSGPTE
jgi:hypothetical protein